MKRFERRSSEVLVLAELLDRAVSVTETRQQVTIVDAAMEQNRNRDWVITRLAVRTSGGRLPRRRGQLFQVEWSEVDGLGIAEPSQGTDALVSMLSELRAADVASALQDMPDKRRREVVAALDDERLADILQELPEDDQIELLHTLADERAADVLEAMDDDDAADLLGEMTAADQQRLLELMEPEEAEPVRRLMTYGDYTAGGLMTSEPVILLPDATVAEALALVRDPELSAGAGRAGFRGAPAAGDTDRPLPRHRAPAADAARAAVGPGQRDLRARYQCTAPERPDRRGDPSPGHLQPGRGTCRRRGQPAARRGVGR